MTDATPVSPVRRARLPALSAETALLVGLGLFVLVFAALPALRLLWEGVGGIAGFDPLRLVQRWDRPAVRIAALNTLAVATGATVIAAAVGTAMAVLVALTDVPARRALVFAFILPMMIPPQVGALAWLQALGPASILLRAVDLAPPIGTPHPLQSPAGIVLLLGLYNAPLVFLAVRATLRALPSELTEAARAGGAGPFAVLRTVVLPLSASGIVAGSALAFVSAAGNFGIQAMLGIPARFDTLVTMIYRRLSGYGPSVLDEVAALALLLGLVAVLGIAVQSRFAGRRDLRVVGRPVEMIFSLGRVRGTVTALAWSFVAVVLVVPLIALLSAALVRGYGLPLTLETLTFRHFEAALLGQSAIRVAFAQSLLLAAATALTLVPVALVLGWLAVRHPSPATRVLGFSVEAAFALPGIVASLAAILLFLRPLPLVDVSIYGTPWIILAAYLGHYGALVLRPVTGAMAQLDPALEEAARIAGASTPRRLLDIVAPILAPAAAVGAILVFLTTLNEAQISILLVTSSSRTIGTTVYFLEESGSSSLASAVGVAIVAIVFLLMATASLFARRLPRGVLPWEP